MTGAQGRVLNYRIQLASGAGFDLIDMIADLTAVCANNHNSMLCFSRYRAVQHPLNKRFSG